MLFHSPHGHLFYSLNKLWQIVFDCSRFWFNNTFLVKILLNQRNKRANIIIERSSEWKFFDYFKNKRSNYLKLCSINKANRISSTKSHKCVFLPPSLFSFLKLSHITYLISSRKESHSKQIKKSSKTRTHIIINADTSNPRRSETEKLFPTFCAQ